MNIRLLALTISVCVTMCLAKASQVVTYQGRLTASGTNFHGPGQFKFALVNSDGSKKFWGNDASNGDEPAAAVTLAVEQGLFTAPLGDASLPNMNVIPPTVFTNADLRLRVWFSDGVGAFTMLSPSQPLTAAPYALMAAQASNVVGVLQTSALSGSYGEAVWFTNQANVFAGNGANLTSLNGGALAGPAALRRLSQTNLKVAFIGDSWSTTLLASSLLTNSFYAGRVTWWSNYAVGGAALLWNGNTNAYDYTGGVWYQYTNRVRPQVLGKTAGEEFHVHVIVGLNDLAVEWRAWTPVWSNLVYTIRADGALPVVYTIPANGIAPDVLPGGFWDSHRLQKNEFIRSATGPDGRPLWAACIDQAKHYHDAFGPAYGSDHLHLTYAADVHRSSFVNDCLLRGSTFVPEEVYRNGGALHVPLLTPAMTANWAFGSINFVWPYSYTNYGTFSFSTNEPSGTSIGRQPPGSLMLVTNGTAWLKVGGNWLDYWSRVTNGYSTEWEQIATVPTVARMAQWRASMPLRYAPLLSGFSYEEDGPLTPDGSEHMQLEDSVKAAPDRVCSIGWRLPRNLRSNLLTEFVLTTEPGLTNLGVKIVSIVQAATESTRVRCTNTATVSLTNGWFTRVPIITPAQPLGAICSARHEFYSLSDGPLTNSFWVIDCSVCSQVE